MSKYSIHPIKDRLDDQTIDHDLFNVPFRGIITAKSGQGKSLTAVNMILLWYRKVFKGDNIYLVLGTKNDDKMEYLIDKKDIPEENIYYEFDENKLHSLYNKLEEEYEINTQMKGDPIHNLWLIDDFGFSNSLNGRNYNSIINKAYTNGRHYNLSVISIYQKYTSMISTAVRNNLTFAIFFKTSNKELSQIAEDMNYLPNDIGDKKFKRMFNDITSKKHNTFTVNLDKGLNDINKLYLDNFETVDLNKYIKED